MQFNICLLLSYPCRQIPFPLLTWGHSKDRNEERESSQIIFHFSKLLTFCYCIHHMHVMRRSISIHTSIIWYARALDHSLKPRSMHCMCTSFWQLVRDSCRLVSHTCTYSHSVYNTLHVEPPVGTNNSSLYSEVFLTQGLLIYFRYIGVVCVIGLLSTMA